MRAAHTLVSIARSAITTPTLGITAGFFGGIGFSRVCDHIFAQ
jgi:hypothetical protein